MRSVLVFLFFILLPITALGMEEVITDIRVRNAVRTEEEAIRSIAGISIGDTLTDATLEVVRERLHSSGLFADVNVYWEPFGVGMRVNIVITEKFPWAPLPTFSYSPGNVSLGGVVVHGNLFGRGKRGVIGGRYSNVDSGALIAYEDPSVFQSWIFFVIKGRFQSQVLPEYSNTALPDMPLLPIRNTKIRTHGFEVSAGVAWFRKVRTSFGWSLDRTNVLSSTPEEDNPYTAGMDFGPAAQSARRGAATATITFDFRGRQHAVVYGNSLGFSLEYAATRWGAQSNVWYWKAGTAYEHGFRFFRRHNVVFRAGAVLGENLPLWSEPSAGGQNLRGYLYRQFQGDSYVRSQVEYSFPLFSVYSLDVRGITFSDAAAIWFSKLPVENGVSYETREDGRQFLPPSYLRQGFDENKDIHVSVGAGIRFYLRSVAVPLVGVDVGHGLGTKDIRMILVLGV
jgi:outer membrane protein assembly factor BamA